MLGEQRSVLTLDKTQKLRSLLADISLSQTRELKDKRWPRVPPTSLLPPQLGICVCGDFGFFKTLKSEEKRVLGRRNGFHR